MSAASTITISDVRIIATLCPAVAVAITGIRFGLRVHQSRLWWDDGFAFLSCIFIIFACVVGGWVHFMDPNVLSRSTRIASYYILSESFYGTLWTARLSILFSVIRITPAPSTKRLLYIAGAAFAIVWAFFFAQLFWVCVPEPNWTDLPAPQCTLSSQVPICQLVTDILADLLLILVPVQLFSSSSLERGLKIRLAAIFSASILTSVVSLVHAAYILKVGGVDELIAAVVEISVSLIVCNLSVVVPALFRASGLGEDVALAREEGFKVSSLKFASRPSKSHGATQPSVVTNPSIRGDISTFGISQITSQGHSDTTDQVDSRDYRDEENKKTHAAFETSSGNRTEV